MRLALISDTHGMLPTSFPPDIDAIIHAGDIGPDREYDWYGVEFARWCARANVPVYFTWGNHDFIGQRVEWQDQRDFLYDLAPNARECKDEAVSIGGKKFWFSPWVTNLPTWAFNLTPEQAMAKHAQIPDDVDFIVSHAPPYGAGDSLRASAIKYGLPNNERVGDIALGIVARKIKAPIICGHIHEDRGITLRDGLHVINVASVNGLYRPQPDRWTLLEI